MYLVPFVLLADCTSPLVQFNQLTKFLPFLFPRTPCASAADHIYNRFSQHLIQTSNLVVRGVAGSVVFLRLSWVIVQNYRKKTHVDPVPRLVRLLWSACILWVIVTSVRFFYLTWPRYMLPDITALSRFPELFEVAPR